LGVGGPLPRERIDPSRFRESQIPKYGKGDNVVLRDTTDNS
jgi:hypothetical protein